MFWWVSDRADPPANAVAKRHYTCQSPDSDQFVPPSTCVVLLAEDRRALWVTTHPKAEYVKHEWAGAWINSLFRNEAPERYLSSELILQAVAATRWLWPEVPTLGLVTFIDPSKVRKKRDFGRCYRKAGFVECERRTKGGLVALQLLPERMPPAEAPKGATMRLIA